MNFYKKLTLTAIAAMTLGVTSDAFAHPDKITRYSLMTNDAFRSSLSSEQIQNLHDFFDYQDREPCQKYKAPPAGFELSGCDLYQTGMKKPAPVAHKMKMDHNIYFGYDSAALDATARGEIARIAKHIKKYGPSDVLVIGHTDTAGSKAYNKGLSQRRADAVTNALTDLGVTSRMIEEAAYSENDLAVPTADGVPMKANRRVEVRLVK